MVAFSDPIFLGIAAALALLFFLTYLLLRRTLLAFREGQQRGRD
jgi:hypothetical protein